MEKVLHPLAGLFGDPKLLLSELERVTYTAAIFNARIKAESETMETLWAPAGTPFDRQIHEKDTDADVDEVLFTDMIGVLSRSADGGIQLYTRAMMCMYCHGVKIRDL